MKIIAFHSSERRKTENSDSVTRGRRLFCMANICKLMTHPSLFRERRKSGRRQRRQCDPDGDGVAWRVDRKGGSQPGVSGHQVSAAQQALPQRPEQEDSHLQDRIGLTWSQYGHAELLPGKQEGDRVCKSTIRTSYQFKGENRAAESGCRSVSEASAFWIGCYLPF